MSDKKESIRSRHPWSMNYTQKEKRGPILGIFFVGILIVLVFYGKGGLEKQKALNTEIDLSLNISISQNSNGQNILLRTANDDNSENASRLGYKILFVADTIGSAFLNILIKNEIIDLAFIAGENLKTAKQLVINTQIKNITFITPFNDSSFMELVNQKIGLSISTKYPIKERGFLQIGRELSAQMLYTGKHPLLKLNYLNTSIMIAPFGLSKKCSDEIINNKSAIFNSSIFICGTNPKKKIVEIINPNELIVPSNDYVDIKNVIKLSEVNNRLSVTLSEKTKSLLIR